MTRASSVQWDVIKAELQQGRQDGTGQETEQSLGRVVTGQDEEVLKGSVSSGDRKNERERWQEERERGTSP